MHLLSHAIAMEIDRRFRQQLHCIPHLCGHVKYALQGSIQNRLHKGAEVTVSRFDALCTERESIKVTQPVRIKGVLHIRLTEVSQNYTAGRCIDVCRIGSLPFDIASNSLAKDLLHAL
jgi:hypothetical protein